MDRRHPRDPPVVPRNLRPGTGPVPCDRHRGEGEPMHRITLSRRGALPVLVAGVVLAAWSPPAGAVPAAAPGTAVRVGAPVPWSATWATAQAAAVPNVTSGYAGFTIRNAVHTTIAGTSVRVHLSNRF